MRRGALLLTMTLATISLAGCLADSQPEMDQEAAPSAPVNEVAVALPEEQEAPAGNQSYSYKTYTMPAVHTGHGLYEPTIDVANDGYIYVSAHSTGLGQVPAPAYYSANDGADWTTLPTPAETQGESDGQGGGAPASDEIFIVAHTDGSAWGVDINLRDYIIQGWCNQGTEHCYYNPNGYDETQAAQQTSVDCQPEPVKDRPWAAASNGKLLMVNNPGTGDVQFGVMDIPVDEEFGVAGHDGRIQWNYCSSPSGSIPGIPDLRPDGFFAIPHRPGGGYSIVTGNVADIMNTEVRFVMPNGHIAPAESDSTPSEISNYGQAVFDATGALFFSAMNNSWIVDDNGQRTPDKGGMHIAVSTDDGQTFTNSTFRFDKPVSNVYIDGNKFGAGALAHWGVIDGANTDWYMGHLTIGDDGLPKLDNVMLAFNDGPEASRHVQGAALGPDGRAYMVMSDVSGNSREESAAQTGETPMRVVVQQTGPVLGPLNLVAQG